jgi:hypothetical protein
MEPRLTAENTRHTQWRVIFLSSHGEEASGQKKPREQMVALCMKNPQGSNDNTLRVGGPMALSRNRVKTSRISDRK